MPEIRHIALLTEDPERLLRFYQAVFDMKEEVGRSPGAIYLGRPHQPVAHHKDGHRRPQRPVGLYHFGFHIDSLDTVREKLRKAGVSDAAPPRPRDGRYAEHRVKDPDGNLIDLAETNWEV
jgi:catechol 2,3-dioxygenase-like lactoylglutathione lyase family enzyme